jgi:hypothetical protein
LKELNDAKSDSSKIEQAVELGNHLLSLITGEATTKPEDIIGEQFIELPNAERFDSWFRNHPDFAGPKSAFELLNGSEPQLQAKLYWLKKRSNSLMAGAVHFTPNWEDAEWTRNDNYKVGIDFFLSPDSKSFHVALSNFGKLRVLELGDKLTNTDIEVLEKWHNLPSTRNLELLHSTIWDSFKLQSVNAKFYNGVADAFTELHDHLVRQGKPDEEAKMFASRLLGRLIFIWFIRKMNLVTGEISYFDPSGQDQGVYYRKKLERLFFRTLNLPVQDRKVEEDGTVDIQTPYLNGGLFSPRNDDWLGQEFSFPGEFFTRLYEHFGNFNFTTDESTPDYEQVAIDPEMLGRVFESLLASQLEETGDQARKAKGTFYTPREIVASMCLEALRTFLVDGLSEFSSRGKEAINILLDTSDQDWVISGTNRLRDLPKDIRPRIESLLSDLKIVDPACGSGAYPLGMLQLLTKTWLRISPSKSKYELKFEILKNNIYGIDIEPMAIEISRLRAWLSLIVDEKGNEIVEPLPNLDFKFVSANSLMPLAEASQISFFDNDELEGKLQKIRITYFQTSDLEKKQSLKSNYAKLIEKAAQDLVESKRTAQIRTFDPFDSEGVAEFFDSKQMFGFEGFDVVIGNPPYVRQEKIGYKKNLQNYRIYDATADLCTYFFELATRLLKPNGLYSYIVTNKFTRALYGEKLRNYLSTETRINYIVDHGAVQHFTASVNTLIIQGQKRRPDVEDVFTINTGPNENFLQSQSSLAGSVWNFMGKESAALFGALENNFSTLEKQITGMYLGIKSGAVETFVITHEQKEKLLSGDPSLGSIIFPVLAGKNLKKITHSESNKFMLVTKNGIDIRKKFPTLAEYFESQNLLSNGSLAARGDKGSHWMNLRDCSYYDKMEGAKIAWSDIAKSNQFALVEENIYVTNTAYILVPKSNGDVNVLAILLNSSLTRAYMRNYGNALGGDGIRWQPHALSKLPTPNLDSLNQRALQEASELVTEVLETGISDSLLNRLEVYTQKLYNLTDEQYSEIKNLAQ